MSASQEKSSTATLKCPASISDESDGEISESSTMPLVNTEKIFNGKSSASTVSSDVQATRFQTLKDRSRVPPGIYISTFVVVSLFYSSGMITTFMSHVVPGLTNSIEYVMGDLKRRVSLLSLYITGGGLENCSSFNQCLSVTMIPKGWLFKLIGNALVVMVISSIYYLLMVKPFRAGMWTGTRAQRHRIHRYMGLVFLLQYSFAWYEFISNYEGSGKSSYLPVSIALNGEKGIRISYHLFMVKVKSHYILFTLCFTIGVIQASSAYFSFKVLPNLSDAGYYSDKAVLSRFFVFENLFFQLYALFGSIYYNDDLRARMQSSLVGKGLEVMFVFFPYLLVRPWFPTTRFSKAGTSMSGRSKANERFYKIGTLMVKFFYVRVLKF